MFRLPTGSENFQELALDKESYLVDKSLFIKELFQNKSKVSIITRPRRFGKTLNLSMLRYFLAEEAMAQDALEQIKSRGYLSEIKAMHPKQVTEVLLIGLAFCKKQFKLLSKFEPLNPAAAQELEITTHVNKKLKFK